MKIRNFKIYYVLVELSCSGQGATNLIYKFLYVTDEKFPRSAVKETLLEALNSIFSPDATFTEIYAQKHELKDGDTHSDKWEIFLGEKDKGLVALSNSGSGLKTILLVLINLYLIPFCEGRDASKYVFAFEELENNLHPSLQRRLLEHIEKFARERNVNFFLTTHSNIALDMFSGVEDAQVTRVVHDGKSASTRDISSFFDCLNVIKNLGAKPSDVLQANGIIWVEGPSDRIIINRWIEIFSNRKWVEGRHYQCVFYGGALLANIGIGPFDNGDKDFLDLLPINPNLVIICDSDKSSPKSHLKKRVRELRAKLKKFPNAFLWITEARELENYYTGDAIGRVYGVESLPNPEQFESFFARESEKELSYWQRNLDRKSYSKMELAMQVAPHLTKQAMSSRFDCSEQMCTLIDKIAEWNS